MPKKKLILDREKIDSITTQAKDRNKGAGADAKFFQGLTPDVNNQSAKVNLLRFKREKEPNTFRWAVIPVDGTKIQGRFGEVISIAITLSDEDFTPTRSQQGKKIKYRVCKKIPKEDVTEEDIKKEYEFLKKSGFHPKEPVLVDNYYYIIMRKAEGLNLNELLQSSRDSFIQLSSSAIDSDLVNKSSERPLSFKDRLEIARTSAHKLVYLHQLKIVHRDVCLDNIVSCRIVHNGLSNWISSIVDYGMSVDDGANVKSFGRWRYSAYETHYYPRVLIHNSAIDIFAFGITLIAFFYGDEEALPQDIGGARITRIPINLLDKIPTIPLEIRNELKELIKKCIDNNPEDRISADDLAKQLDDLYEKYLIFLSQSNFAKLRKTLNNYMTLISKIMSGYEVRNVLSKKHIEGIDDLISQQLSLKSDDNIPEELIKALSELKMGLLIVKNKLFVLITDFLDMGDALPIDIQQLIDYLDDCDSLFKKAKGSLNQEHIDVFNKLQEVEAHFLSEKILLKKSLYDCITQSISKDDKASRPKDSLHT